MSFSIARRRLLLTGAAVGAARDTFAQSRDADVFEISKHETATMDGRHWDTPMPGGTTVDAAHRSVLLRFPTAAEEIAGALRRGRVLAKAELVLRYDGYEIVPEGYLCREGLGRKQWTDDPPTWHIQAWPLRRAWKADKATGPTFNASVNSRRYWARYGAADPALDRYPDPLEPQELSSARTEARIDITPLLASAALEREAGQRLLWLALSGFLLSKVETYDSRYRASSDAYEWAMPTGGHGLSFTTPRLAVTTRRTGGTVAITLPPPLEQEWQLGTSDKSKPTAVQFSPKEVVERARQALLPRGKRQDWEVRRLNELRKVGGDNVSAFANVEGDKGYRDYQTRLSRILAIPPRYWMGWDIEDNLLIWYLFRDLLPAPVQDYMKGYWTAWLQPELATKDFLFPQGREAVDYWKRTHDWRGRASFFRDGFNYSPSTENFNHTAAMGALLGGAMIGSERAMADGRHGLETLPLRFWAFLDGSTQEMLDPYYFSITLSAQKMFADFAPTPIDRLMGRILVDRTMEMLITAYHSRLRRFVSSAGRARVSGLLVEQDGIYGVLHTVSKDGAANYLDQPDTGTSHGMPVWGYDFPPGRVAMQALPSPWAPSWVSGLIDDKPVPFEETAAETTRGNFKPPLWRRVWLGRWHGLASADIRGITADLMAQWVRAPKRSTRLEDLGALTARYQANAPNLVTTVGGGENDPGLLLTFQSRNRAIVFTKPHNNRERLLEALGKAGVSQLATVIGLWNFADTKDWEIFVDDQKVISLPQRMTSRQRLLIRDGVSYLALQPLPATDLGRDVEIEIRQGSKAWGGGKAPPNDAEVAPALVVSMYNFKRAAPVAVRELDLDTVMTATFGGFVLEMGDAEQYGSFDAFVRHIKQSALTATWREKRHLLEVTYKTGDDVMEVGFTTDFGQPAEVHYVITPGEQEKAIPWRRLNGQWPYLSSGLERDTTWAQQGTTGRLEKNGAVLITEPGRKAYLLADPLSGAVVAYNPLPDPQAFTLTTRDGLSLKAHGKVGLLRVEYRPWAREIDITHALKPDQTGENMVKHFRASGLAEPPRVTVNGQPVEPAKVGQDFQIAVTSS